MRVLITGGAGFIGSHLADAYIGRGDEVFVLDDYRRAEEGVEIDSPSLRVGAALASLRRRGWETEEDSDDTAWESIKMLAGGWTASLAHTAVDVRFLGARPDEGVESFALEDGTFGFHRLVLSGPGGAKTADAPPIVFSAG